MMLLSASFESSYHGHRALYNTSFVSAGCPPDQYDPVTALDTTVATYVTNYVIGVVGFVGVGVIYGRWVGGSTTPTQCYCLMGYFGATAVGYVLAGVAHQVYRTTDDHSSAQDALFATSLWLVAVGIVGLQLERVLVVAPAAGAQPRNAPSGGEGLVVDEEGQHEGDDGESGAQQQQKQQQQHHQQQPCGSNSFMAVIAIFLGVVTQAVILGIVTNDLAVAWMIGSVYIALGLLVTALVSLIRYRDWGAGMGALVYESGLVLQVLLSSRCGPDAYEDCFAQCPLPATTWNHNALFHLLVTMGLLIQMIGGRYDGQRSPGCCYQESRSLQKTEEQTDGSHNKSGGTEADGSTRLF